MLGACVESICILSDIKKKKANIRIKAMNALVRRNACGVDIGVKIFVLPI